MRELWNVVAAVAGVLAVAVALFVFFQERTDKSQRLEMIQLSRTSLVNPELASSGRRIEILYNGKKVADYTVFQFRMTNIGGQPIRSADYEVPLGLNFANVSEVLWADQTKSDPQGLRVATTVRDKAVELSSALLNPKDSLTLEVGVVPEVGKIPAAEPVGRIAGVKKIEFVLTVPPSSKDKEFPWWADKIVYTQGFLVLILLGLQIARRRNRSWI